MRTTWMVSLSLAVLGLFSACHPKRETVPTTGTTRPGTTPRRASFTFKAAPNMALSARTIPGPPGAETRPVAAVQDEKGIRTEFVENEVLFSAKDEREVQVLLERYPGKIIRKLDLQLKHSPSRSVYVLQIDPSRARNVTLDNAWPAVAPRSRGGTFQVSSEAALNLLRNRSPAHAAAGA